MVELVIANQDLCLQDICNFFDSHDFVGYQSICIAQ
jgi:hypothetical protein